MILSITLIKAKWNDDMEFGLKDPIIPFRNKYHEECEEFISFSQGWGAGNFFFGSSSSFFSTGSISSFFFNRLQLLIFFQPAPAPHFFLTGSGSCFSFFFNRLRLSVFSRLRYVCVSGV